MRGRNQGELFGSERVKVQVFQTKLNCTTKMQEKHIFVHQKILTVSPSVLVDG